MTLPELPKGKNREEAKMDGPVAEWFFNNHPHPVILEVKMKGGKVEEHQQRLINKVSKEHRFMYKFRDGNVRTPLDYIIVPNRLDAVLAVCEGRKCECTINNTYKINIKV
jgi:hypothetical protein